MPRFRQGTNDHDGDGRKGGSMPGKKAAPKRASKPKGVVEKQEAVEAQFAEADAQADPAVEAATLGRQMRGW